MTDESLAVTNFKKGFIAFGHLLDMQGTNRAEVLEYYKAAFPLPEAHLDYGFIALGSKLESVALENFRIAVDGGRTECVDQIVMLLQGRADYAIELERYLELAKKLDTDGDFKYLRSKFFTLEGRGESREAFAIFERIFNIDTAHGNYLLTYFLSFPEVLDNFGELLVQGGYLTEFELEDPELIQAKIVRAMDESVKTLSPFGLKAKFRYLASQGLWSEAQEVAAKGFEIEDPDLILLYAIAWQNAGYKDQHPLQNEFFSKFNITSLMRLDSDTIFDDDDLDFEGSQPRLGMDEFNQELKRERLANVPDSLAHLVTIKEISEEFFDNFDEVINTGKNYKSAVANLVSYARAMDPNFTFALDKVGQLLQESIDKNTADPKFLSFLIRNIQAYEDLAELNFVLLKSAHISEDTKMRIYQSHASTKCLLLFDNTHCILKDSLELGIVPDTLISLQLRLPSWRLDVEHRELLNSYYKARTHESSD